MLDCLGPKSWYESCRDLRWLSALRGTPAPTESVCEWSGQFGYASPKQAVPRTAQKDLSVVQTRPKELLHCREKQDLTRHWLGLPVWGLSERAGLNHYFQDCKKKADLPIGCIGMAAGSGRLTVDK